jgi:plastocyanin
MRYRHILVTSVLFSLVACGGGGTTSPTYGGTPSTGTPGTTGGSTPTQTNAVQVIDNSFSPSAIQVAPGTVVTWTWPNSTGTHNITFTDGSGSGDKSGPTSFSKAFPTAGTFNYSCTLHGGMNGSVLVKQ